MRPVAAWGRLDAPLHRVLPLHDREDARRRIPQTGAPGLAHGMGRSYGDVCLNPGGVLWQTTGLDRFIAFDPETGRLHCESGVLLSQIQRLTIPRGWALPVIPGTQLITVGGAVANDVHGKNHHGLGTFGDHILALTLLRSDGEIIECGPRLRPEWFSATVGGLGLTGVILDVAIQMRRSSGPWLETETRAFCGLEEFFGLADAAQSQWEHTVAWIDCLTGSQVRGLFMCGRPAAQQSAAPPEARARRLPFAPPISPVNRYTLKLFNYAYLLAKQHRGRREREFYGHFLCPLDALLDWNKMYGPRGFYQYQCVVPRTGGHEAIAALLREIAQAGEGSFLAVLKTFGERGAPGMLSFAREGATLALDFPNRGEASLRLFARLDAIVLEAGGRIYPAKDARMSAQMFGQGYPKAQAFCAYRDPGITSGLSRRLLGS